MKRFEQNYTVFLEHGDLSGLKERYSELLVNKDREVRILGACSSAFSARRLSASACSVPSSDSIAFFSSSSFSVRESIFRQNILLDV